MHGAPYLLKLYNCWHAVLLMQLDASVTTAVISTGTHHDYSIDVRSIRVDTYTSNIYDYSICCGHHEGEKFNG